MKETCSCEKYSIFSIEFELHVQVVEPTHYGGEIQRLGYLLCDITPVYT